MSKISNLSNLRFSVLNINGLISRRTNKIKSREFQDILNSSDVVLLTETWTNDFSDIYVNNFEAFVLHRKEKKKNSKRDSGGIIVFIRNKYITGETLVFKSYDDIICIKISKSVF